MSGWIEDHREGVHCKQVIVTGFHGIWEAHKDREFREMLNSADLWIPDGMAPVVVARIRGCSNAVRAPGADIMPAFLRLADKKGYSSFFYGDSEDTLETLEKNLKIQYPGHIIAGTFSPPFRKLSSEEESDHVRMINDARPDVLWVGLGLPKQERWINRNLSRLNVPVAIGVGACFIFFSGKVKAIAGVDRKDGLRMGLAPFAGAQKTLAAYPD
jgi:N-acetylglucosaminyldiphosphoundecaprenol N-acetyl-beta-D-mannosaminyltransferase